MFKKKIILITGGTGSFGNAFLERLLELGPREIRVFSRDEKKQDDMRRYYNNEMLKFYIGDVRDTASLDEAVANVDYIFHAAALKQVPSCEFYPLEAVKTNVLGAENVISVAIRREVKKVILLSTDKAVYPINAMGMTKALMERIMVGKARSLDAGKTIVCATRYGNVMGSRGSVIPLFIDQIKSGVPLSITNPKMTRFLMSLQQSVELVLYAFANGQNGDIFVQKAPSGTILDIARAISSMFGSEDSFKIIGTRHGEKLYESLLSREEMCKAKDLGGYYCVPADNRDLNYEKYFSSGETEIERVEDYNSHNTTRLNSEEIVELLKKQKFVQDSLHV